MHHLARPPKNRLRFILSEIRLICNIGILSDNPNYYMIIIDIINLSLSKASVLSFDIFSLTETCSSNRSCNADNRGEIRFRHVKARPICIARRPISRKSVTRFLRLSDIMGPRVIGQSSVSASHA